MARGKKTGGGSRRGVLNKRTQEVEELFRRYHCNPLIRMMQIVNDPAVEDMALKASLLKELAQYVYPKRKAIEHSGPDGEPFQIEVESFEYQAAVAPIAGRPTEDC